MGMLIKALLPLLAVLKDNAYEDEPFGQEIAAANKG